MIRRCPSRTRAWLDRQEPLYARGYWKAKNQKNQKKNKKQRRVSGSIKNKKTKKKQRRI